MEPATEACLLMPDLLGSVLLFLGPLDWLECGPVCSLWSVTVRDDSSRSTPPAADGDSWLRPVPVSINLWREFVTLVMKCVPHLPIDSDCPSDGQRGDGRGTSDLIVDKERDGGGYNGSSASTAFGEGGGRGGDGRGRVTVDNDRSTEKDTSDGIGNTCHRVFRRDTGNPRNEGVGTVGRRLASHGTRSVCNGDPMEGSGGLCGASAGSSRVGGRSTVNGHETPVSYKTICLEGDPVVLRLPRSLAPRPALTFDLGSLSGVAAARSRRPM